MLCPGVVVVAHVGAQNVALFAQKAGLSGMLIKPPPSSSKERPCLVVPGFALPGSMQTSPKLFAATNSLEMFGMLGSWLSCAAPYLVSKAPNLQSLVVPFQALAICRLVASPFNVRPETSNQARKLTRINANFPPLPSLWPMQGLATMVSQRSTVESHGGGLTPYTAQTCPCL